MTAKVTRRSDCTIRSHSLGSQSKMANLLLNFRTCVTQQSNILNRCKLEHCKMYLRTTNSFRYIYTRNNRRLEEKLCRFRKNNIQGLHHERSCTSLAKRTSNFMVEPIYRQRASFVSSTDRRFYCTNKGNGVDSDSPTLGAGLMKMVIPEDFPNLPMIAINKHPVLPFFSKKITVSSRLFW